MSAQQHDAVPLESGADLSLSELSRASGLSIDELAALVDAGVLIALDQHAATLYFPAEYLYTTRLAVRLRDDFELETHGLALALTLLSRIRQLEVETRRLETLTPTWPWLLRNTYD